MAQLYRSVSAAALVLLAVGVVQAQQPVSELGGWPPGTITLLAGAWLCIMCLSESKYDVLPTVLFSRILHKIPALRSFLTSNQQFGSLTKELIFTPIEYSGVRIIQEWDTLTLLSRGLKFKFCGPSFTFRQAQSMEDTESNVNHDKIFDLEILTGVDMERFNNGAKQLLQEVDLTKGDDQRPRIDKLLRLWRALRIYQQSGQRTEWSEAWQQDQFNDVVEHYKRVMESANQTPDENFGTECTATSLGIFGTLEKIRMTLYYPDSPYGANELPMGATTEKEAISAKHIAAVLAFTEYVCGDRYKGINPLILCIWIWMRGRLHPSDNMIITLPSSVHFIYPQTATQWSQEGEEQTPRTPSKSSNILPHTPNVLDLSSDNWDIDGGTFINVWKVIWIFSLTTSILVAFFTVLSNAGNPNLATTLGLLFVRPYSIDSNLRDSGYPPSWNGRRQLRWDGGYKCGIFKGKFYKKMGPTGNSLFRSIVVYAVSWMTWHWRKPLRMLMEFAQPVPTSTWVQWVAVCFEFTAMLACCSGIFMLIAWRQTIAAITCAVNSLSLAISSALMVRYMVTGRGRGVLFWYSELGLLTAVFFAAVIHRGVGPSHGPFLWYITIVWIHTIAASCFSPP